MSYNYTSNQEYGRGVVMSMQKPSSKTYNGMASPWMNSYPQIGGQKAFTPGHAHAPNCPNFGVGMGQTNQSYGQGVGMSQANQSYGQGVGMSQANQSYGQGVGMSQANQSYGQGVGMSQSNQSYGQVYGNDGKVLGATSGVFSTGGDSATDFTVYVGEEAIAKMGQNERAQVQALQQQPNVNYYMPQQPNVSAGGGSMMNFQNSSAPIAQTQGQSQQFGNNVQNPQQHSYAQQTAQTPTRQNSSGQMKPQGKNKAVRFGGMGCTNSGSIPPYNAPPQPPVVRGLGNKYRNRPIIDQGSLDFAPGEQPQSNVRAATPKPKYQLCGRCSKCKSLKDPSAGAPSIANFKAQGLTPHGSRRFPIPTAFPKPKSTKSTPNMSTGGHTGMMPGNVTVMPTVMVGNPTQMYAGDTAAPMTITQTEMAPENTGAAMGKSEIMSGSAKVMTGNMSGDGNPNVSTENATAAM